MCCSRIVWSQVFVILCTYETTKVIWSVKVHSPLTSPLHTVSHNPLENCTAATKTSVYIYSEGNWNTRKTLLDFLGFHDKTPLHYSAFHNTQITISTTLCNTQFLNLACSQNLSICVTKHTELLCKRICMHQSTVRQHFMQIWKSFIQKILIVSLYVKKYK